MSQISVLTLFDSLALFGKTVQGVAPQNSFKESETPDKLNDSQLPALILYPGQGRGDEFKFQTFMAGAPHLKIQVAHQLVIAPSQTTQYKTVAVRLLQLLLNYCVAAQAKGFLDTRDTTDGTRPWQVPMNFTPVIGPNVMVADIAYHGIQFLYDFDIQL